MDHLGFAADAKGPLGLLQRAYGIGRSYGVTPKKMVDALDLFARILARHGCGASFAIPAVVLGRNRDAIARYLDRNIEFVVHGYTHLDYSQLEPDLRREHLCRGRKVFADVGVPAVGFRAPYLRHGYGLDEAIKDAGFAYKSNQPVLWNVIDRSSIAPAANASYERAIQFYAPWDAENRSVVPRLDAGLVEIPVSLPDDEMLVDRLNSHKNRRVGPIWQSMLSETHKRQELLTIQLHPERISVLAEDLTLVLDAASRLEPHVWIARLGEIDAWWRARANAEVQVRQIQDDTWQLTVSGPDNATILARNIEILGAHQLWDGDYRRVTTTTFEVRGDLLPFVGVSPACPQELVHFVRRQGYIVQTSDSRQGFSAYLDQPTFSSQDEQSVLCQIEQGQTPLVRLGRWPDGARSALVISGDIDAMTLWDYGSRLFGQ